MESYLILHPGIIDQDLWKREFLTGQNIKFPHWSKFSILTLVKIKFVILIFNCDLEHG